MGKFFPASGTLFASVTWASQQKLCQSSHPRNQCKYSYCFRDAICYLTKILSSYFKAEIGEPCKDFILEAGDMVYLPRGTIHQV